MRLTLYHLVPSADNFCNLDPDQAQQNVGPDLDGGISEFFKVAFEKNQQMTNKLENFPGGKVLMESATTLKHLNTSLTFCLLGNFSCFFVICWFFSKSTFSKYSFRNIIWVSKRLDPDQARHSVGPDLCLICFQRLSADNTSRQWVMHLNTSLTCCLLGNFACSFVVCWFFSKSTFLEKFFQEYQWQNHLDILFSARPK